MISFNFANSLSRAKPIFVQTPCEDLLVLKHKDQTFWKIHEVQTQNNKNSTT